MSDLTPGIGLLVLVAALCGVGIATAALAGESGPAAVAASPGEAEIRRGKLLFLQCRACHEVASGQPHKVGPNLHGVMGRKAALAEGYAYSDALKKSGLTWDFATLDNWIKHPASIVPGTTMAFVGIPGEADRRALIAYLESATR